MCTVAFTVAVVMLLVMILTMVVVVVVNMGYATKVVIQLAFLSIPISSIRIHIIYGS